MRTVHIQKDSPLLVKAYQLFVQSVQNQDMLTKKMSFEKFQETLYPARKGITAVNLLEEEGRAFASGCLDENIQKTFITMVIVKEDERGRGLGRWILNELEQELIARGERHRLEISFFNPITLSWVVPGRKGAEHPNMPGVDIGSGAYLFLKNCGYRDFSMQNSYYAALDTYHYPKAMEAKKNELDRAGFKLELYDKGIHTGMEEMLRRFGNLMWEREILGEPSRQKGGRPILVPVYEKRVCGFTGPLDVEKNGRGYFAGIGIDPDFRGKGLAKLLFCELCQALKKEGASYMTLFTGENNPARNIYEDAGFTIVRTWADMRKED